ncbi:MAG TPA: transglutaminase domain-containing protein [Burkholderiales bacterium]|nr:transglutaminase domain-containing protein [Burkholderiales bacterium]
MRPPPYLLALGLLFWGFCSGFEAVAAALALALEAPRWLRMRWELSHRDFERVADLCTAAFAGALVFQFVRSRQFPDSLVCVLGWLPMLYFPLILTQRYSSQGAVPLSALFWSLRPRRGAGRVGVDTVALDYAYFLCSGVAASSANPRSSWFFVGLWGLSLYALSPTHPRQRSWVAWAFAFAVAGALGFGVQAGLARAQSKMEELVFEWLSQRWTQPADAYRTRTAIGELGEVPASDRIVLRVDAHGQEPPQRLRSATYSVYATGSWLSRGEPFLPVVFARRHWEWGSGSGRSVRVATWHTDASRLLALPLGTFRIDGSDVGNLERNALGAVRADQAPDLLRFDAQFDPALSLDAPPGPADLALPPSIVPALQQVASEIALPERNAHAAVRAIAAFFETQFTYTLSLSAPDSRDRPRSLSAFLLEDRRGHCEYFATAAVLLLRRAGVPARYATGYAVQEWSPWERQYVVRERHAHAWALAWLDGRWQELDTTPARWAEEGAARASPLRALYDLLSLLNYRLTVWQDDGSATGGSRMLMLCGAGTLLAYLAWRVRRRQRVHRRTRAEAARAHAWVAADGRIHALLERLAALGYTRPFGEPLVRWAERLDLADPHTKALLREALQRYYRARFDPRGLPPDEDGLLTEQTFELLRRLRARG